MTSPCYKEAAARGFAAAAISRNSQWSQKEIHSGARKMTRPALTLQDLRVLLSISAAKAGPNEDAVAVRATWEQTLQLR
jgi:hypothetical protein